MTKCDLVVQLEGCDSYDNLYSSKMSTKAKIKIGQPATFNGKASDASYWIGSVHTYISLNMHIYDSDNKKVTFILSFYREGAMKSLALGCY